MCLWQFNCSQTLLNFLSAYFGKKIILCQAFLLLNVQWCFTQFTETVKFSVIPRETSVAPACWWHRWCQKNIPDLRRLERNWKLMRCIEDLDLVLNCCSDINEGKYIHFFHFNCWWKICFLVRNGSFPSVSFSSCWFSRFPRLLKPLQLGCKTELTNAGLILEFFYWKRPGSTVTKSAATEIGRNDHMCFSIADFRILR